MAAQSKNYRYSTNHQVVIDADTCLVVAIGRPLPGNRNDCKAWEESGAKAAAGKTITIADGGYRGTGLVIPHRLKPGQTEPPEWKEEHNTAHRKVRARVEHVFARMKGWKILRDCRLKGDTVFTTPCWASPVCTTSPAPDERAGRTSRGHVRADSEIIYGTTLSRTPLGLSRSWRHVCPVGQGLVAGGADAGPAPQDVLESVEDVVEGEADVGTFGARRCSVRKAWAAVTRVTRWCQPGQERPSKWSRPRPCLSSR